MAVLTATGINFSDGTSLDSKRGIFPQSTAWVFYQATTPTGWTKLSTQDNKGLRVVSGSGGAAAGTNTFSATMTSFNVNGTLTTAVASGGYALLAADITAHTHPSNSFAVAGNPTVLNPDGSFNSWGGGDVGRPAPGGTGSWVRNSPVTGSIGSGAAHSHPVSASGPINQPVSIAVQYVDIVICTFDG